MSFDAYIEKQSHQFDTFRKQFHLSTGETATAQVQSPDTISKLAKDRTSSTTTFREILVSIADEEPDQVREAPTLSFAPTVRRLDVAPWETQDTGPSEEPKKTKSPRSFFSKFRRTSTKTTSDGNTLQTSNVKADQHSAALARKEGSEETEKANVVDRPEGPAAETKTEKVRAIVRADDATHEDFVLAPPLITPNSSELHETIAFQPVDPNILHLRQPAVQDLASSTLKDMKPSRSTPQIHYDILQAASQKDRMSRMFDGLQF